jgi:antitoxin HigA-1
MTPTNGMRPVHPGEILREDFLAPLDLSVNALAQALRVPGTRLHEIVKERRAVTPDTALRLSRYFGGDAQSWLNLQASYDLKVAERELGAIIATEVRPRAA